MKPEFSRILPLAASLMIEIRLAFHTGFHRFFRLPGCSWIPFPASSQGWDHFPILGIPGLVFR